MYLNKKKETGLKDFGEKPYESEERKLLKWGVLESKVCAEGEISVNSDWEWTLVWLLMDDRCRLPWSKPWACFEDKLENSTVRVVKVYK